MKRLFYDKGEESAVVDSSIARSKISRIDPSSNTLNKVSPCLPIDSSEKSKKIGKKSPLYPFDRNTIHTVRNTINQITTVCKSLEGRKEMLASALYAVCNGEMTVKEASDKFELEASTLLLFLQKLRIKLRDAPPKQGLSTHAIRRVTDEIGNIIGNDELMTIRDDESVTIDGITVPNSITLLTLWLSIGRLKYSRARPFNETEDKLREKMISILQHFKMKYDISNLVEAIMYVHVYDKQISEACLKFNVNEFYISTYFRVVKIFIDFAKSPCTWPYHRVPQFNIRRVAVNAIAIPMRCGFMNSPQLLSKPPGKRMLNYMKKKKEMKEEYGLIKEEPIEPPLQVLTSLNEPSLKYKSEENVLMDREIKGEPMDEHFSSLPINEPVYKMNESATSIETRVLGEEDGSWINDLPGIEETAIINQAIEITIIRSPFPAITMRDALKDAISRNISIYDIGKFFRQGERNTMFNLILTYREVLRELLATTDSGTACLNICGIIVPNTIGLVSLWLSAGRLNYSRAQPFFGNKDGLKNKMIWILRRFKLKGIEDLVKAIIHVHVCHRSVVEARDQFKFGESHVSYYFKIFKIFIHFERSPCTWPSYPSYPIVRIARKNNVKVARIISSKPMRMPTSSGIVNPPQLLPRPPVERKMNELEMKKVIKEEYGLIKEEPIEPPLE